MGLVDAEELMTNKLRMEGVKHCHPWMCFFQLTTGVNLKEESLHLVNDSDNYMLPFWNNGD